MSHLRTCSEDEDFAVVGAYSESSVDTDELLGNVDWSLAQGSDDYDAHWPHVLHAAPEQSPAAPPGPPRPSALDPHDWMFDISRRGAPGAAGASGAARRAVTLINPAAVAAGSAAPRPPPQAGGGQGRAPERAAAAGGPSTSASSAVAAAGGACASAQPQPSPRPRPPPEQQGRAAGAGAGAAGVVCPLPGGLDARLDRLLSDFAGGGASGGGGPSARRVQRRPLGSDSGSGSGSEDGGALGGGGIAVERVALDPGAGTGARVVFANSLPPRQANFRLEYSDAPAAAWLRAGGLRGRPACGCGAPGRPHCSCGPR
ncbi:MAG: hypothetical protein J3K34DRAFT_442602 [Monoraphidium minutum]|nr:MAG: hypothetical protein J3K34DRAFT_442602 [Monoraphidium minutum]